MSYRGVNTLMRCVKVKMKNGVEDISQKQFEEIIKKSVVVIDFYADWCMPCLMIAPVIEEMADKFKGKIKFARVNVDDNKELASQFKIMSIPTLIVFKNGQPKERITGALPPHVLEQKFEKFVE